MSWPENPVLDQDRSDIPINENFDALKAKADEHAATLAANTSNIATNTSAIASQGARLTTAEGTLVSQGGRLTKTEHTTRKIAGNTLPSALAEGANSVAAQVLGDSTGNGTDEWVHLLGQDLAAAFPAYEVRHYIWDSNAGLMPTAPLVIQSGATPRGITFTGAASSSVLYAGASLTGDLDIRVKVQIPNWATGNEMVLACRFGSPPNRAWRFYVGGSGQLNFDWSTDGSNLQTTVVSGAWAMPTTPLWVRVTLDVDNGSTQHVIQFWRSDDGVTWTQVGSTTTRSSVTSVVEAASQPYELAARGGGSVLVGTIYEAHIRHPNGYLMAPALPECWYNYGSATPDPSGSPILTLVNGSHPGAGLSYLNGPLTLERMTPNYGQAVAIISTSHNETTTHSGLYGSMASYVTNVATRLPGIPIVALTQNPRIAPASARNAQAVRRLDYLSWERALGWSVIDTYQAFLDDARGVAALVNADGFHPNADGEVVWKNAVKAALGLA